MASLRPDARGWPRCVRCRPPASPRSGWSPGPRFAEPARTAALRLSSCAPVWDSARLSSRCKPGARASVEAVDRPTGGATRTRRGCVLVKVPMARARVRWCRRGRPGCGAGARSQASALARAVWGRRGRAGTLSPSAQPRRGEPPASSTGNPTVASASELSLGRGEVGPLVTLHH